jgi:protein disulfide-isomerase A6
VLWAFQALNADFHLSLEAGRHPEFDSLASKFFMATGAARDSIYKEASSLAVKVGPTASRYLRVMEKVVNGTEDYIAKESKR